MGATAALERSKTHVFGYTVKQAGLWSQRVRWNSCAACNSSGGQIRWASPVGGRIGVIP